MVTPKLIGSKSPGQDLVLLEQGTQQGCLLLPAMQKAQGTSWQEPWLASTSAHSGAWAQSGLTPMQAPVLTTMPYALQCVLSRVSPKHCCKAFKIGLNLHSFSIISFSYEGCAASSVY